MVAKSESIWRVVGVDATDQATTVVYAENAIVPVDCPRCRSLRRPRRYGAIESSYRDAPFLGRKASVTVTAQRFQCGECGQAFLQDLPNMDGKRRMTARCADYIVAQVMARSSMKEVARIIGIDEKGARNIFDDRGLIFSVGNPANSDGFVCESCLGIHPKSGHRLAPAKHFGKWRRGELLGEANVCAECFDFASDPWRAGIVKRL